MRESVIQSLSDRGADLEGHILGWQGASCELTSNIPNALSHPTPYPGRL
jgi:hypothetical protein